MQVDDISAIKKKYISAIILRYSTTIYYIFKKKEKHFFYLKINKECNLFALAPLAFFKLFF